MVRHQHTETSRVGERANLQLEGFHTHWIDTCKRLIEQHDTGAACETPRDPEPASLPPGQPTRRHMCHIPQTGLRDGALRLGSPQTREFEMRARVQRPEQAWPLGQVPQSGSHPSP